MRGLKEVSVRFGDVGESASDTQYAQVLCATDGKVGFPGGARQEMVRVQWSRAVWKMVTHSILFHLCYCFISLSVAVSD